MFGVTQEEEQQQASNPPSSTTPTAEEEALKRNTDCVYFLASPLTCKKGSECEYRHSDVARVNPRDCWYWLNGNCLNLKCAFRHPPLDGLLGTQVPTPLGNSLPPSQVILEPSAAAPYVQGKQAVPCIYFQRGNCLKGDVCPFVHGLYSARNKVAQFATATPVAESQPNKTFSGLGKCSQEQKVSQVNSPNPVNLALHPKLVTTIESNQLRNGVVMKKNVPLSTSLDEEIARQRPTNVRSASNENPGSRLNRNHQIYVSDDQSMLNSKDTEDFSREPSPGFDVLVDDKRRDSEYYPREDQFRRSIGHEGRNMNPVDDYEIGRSDYNSEVDPVMYRESRGYDSYGTYGREERRVSSESVLSGSAQPERRRYPRTDNFDQMDGVDLRHHLSKQKRGNGLRSVVIHDHSHGSHVEDQTYQASQRDHLATQESSLSSRFRGRIKVPGRSTSPVTKSVFLSEREVERVRHRGRLSPERPQGRLRDIIKVREQEDISSEKNFRGSGIRDRDDNNAEFTGPKRLAELRVVKKSDGYEQPISERLSLGKRKFPKLEGAPQQVDGDLSFKGPMPLSEILKRKRGGEVAGSESGMTSANNENDGNKSSVMAIENKETKGAFSSVSSDVVNHVDKEESKLAASDVGEVDEKSTEGHSSLQLETEEGMIGDEAIEDQDAEGYNQRGGEYDYEQADGEDYNLDEGENADLEEEYYEEEEEEDADDFAKKMGVV